MLPVKHTMFTQHSVSWPMAQLTYRNNSKLIQTLITKNSMSRQT